MRYRAPWKDPRGRREAGWYALGSEEEGGRQPGFSRGQMAAQLHDLRMVETAKKEFEEYVRQQVSSGPACRPGILPGRPTRGEDSRSPGQGAFFLLLAQDMATKRIFSALRVLPDTMRNLLFAQKDAILARHRAALLCHGREQALEALEAELQAEAKAFMDAYTMRFCGHLAAVGGAVGAGLMGLAGGVVGAGMAAAALAAEAGMVAAGAAVGATGAAVVGGGVGAGLAATVGCMEKEEYERVQEGDREPLLQEE